MTPRSIKPDLPVDPVTVDILRAVAEETQAEGIDYLLVGATACDVLLTHVHGLVSRRATYDVDFAVAVKNWDQFAALRTRLIARGAFNATDKAQQRLYYQAPDSNLAYQLDLVPFGGISEGTNAIAWPPDMKIIMNIAGYDDVLAAAELVTFAPDFDGKVVSLPGLAGEYDPDLAGVYLLGKDIRRVTSADTLDIVRHIIERDFERLVHQMTKAMRHLEDAEDHVDKRLRLLQHALA